MIFAAILLALIILGLAIPFEIIFNIQRKKGFHSDVVVHWLFGVVKFNIAKQHKQKVIKEPTRKKQKKKAKKKRTSIGAAKDLFWNAKFRYRLIRFVKDIFKSIHIAAFNLRIKLGLNDPADTGRLWAYLGPLSVFLSNLSNTKVQLEPDFQTEVLYLNSNGVIRVVPLEVVFTVLSFVFSPITIKALWGALKSSNQ